MNLAAINHLEERVSPPPIGVWAIPAISLAVGVWLRLRHLGYSEMWGDQSQLLAIALQWLNGGSVPLASMKSSFGVFNPPLIEYLYAGALWLWRDLWSVLWLTVIVNLIGVFASGWAVARVLGLRAGLWVTVLFVVCPWAFYYSRLIWMQTLVPGFGGVLFASVLMYFTHQPRMRYLLIACVSLAGVIQLHLSAVVLFGALGLIGLVFRRLINWRTVLVGGLLFGLTFVPFLVYQWQTNWVDINALRQGLGREPFINYAALLAIFDLIHSQGVFTTLGSIGDVWRIQERWYEWSDVLVSLIFLGGASVAFWNFVPALARRQVLNPKATVGLIAVVWIVVPVVAFIRHTHYLQNYYFLYVWPAPFVLMVLGIEALATRLSQMRASPVWRGWMSQLAFLPLLVVFGQQARMAWLGQNLQALDMVGKQRVLDMRQAVDTSQRLLTENPTCDLTILSEGPEANASSFGFLEEWLGPERVRFMQAGLGQSVPNQCTLYFAPTDNELALTWLTANTQILPEAIATPEQKWIFTTLSDTRLVELRAAWQAPVPLARWQNGIVIHRVQIPSEVIAGSDLPVQITWEATTGAVPGSLHISHQILQERTQVIAQTDGQGFDSNRWEPGDLIQTSFMIPIPAETVAGQYDLLIVLYTFPDLRRERLLDGSDVVWVSSITITRN